MCDKDIYADLIILNRNNTLDANFKNILADVNSGILALWQLNISLSSPKKTKYFIWLELSLPLVFSHKFVQ